ncbi:hypothetical protein B6S12_03700 [Helicobacter valdiviensis]|uniref:Histidine kinase n=1 Tax=Helicobacter valdiviensis TaxID=1458358 RepID=A0A2W6PP10_9HELI|nr:hypothetical protein [Helicobacter valdiviensis]PZT48443.1 hypothetical protein B6S12_03700 [Helicobacter valdiviensis]
MSHNLELYLSFKQQAKEAFTNRNYHKALQYFSFAFSEFMEKSFTQNFLSKNSIKVPKFTHFSTKPLKNEIKNPLFKAENFPTLKEIELEKILMYSKLADMALIHEDEARALFDYYQSLKSKGINAIRQIVSMIENFDTSVYELNFVLENFQNHQIEQNDGVMYEDFTRFVEQVGFKEAFTNLMFSSKIIITSKREFLKFMQDLLKNGFSEVALNYFESAGNSIFYDKDFVNLYKMILQKSGK